MSSISVTIAGTDRSDQIEWQSLEVEQQVTNQVDTCKFSLKVHAAKTFRPAIGDEVIVFDGAGDTLITEDGDTLITEDGDTLTTEATAAAYIFGGTVVRIDDVIEAGLLTRLSITCVSHERTLDRFLVVREFEDVSARYMLNAILNEVVNQPSFEIDLGETSETWTTEDGTVAANTTNGQFLEGEQSRKFTALVSATATARRESALDLTLFSDSSISTTDDKIKIVAYVANVQNVDSIRVRFGSDPGALYTNYFEYTIPASDLVDGFNELFITKIEFTSNGLPAWDNIQKRQYRVTANANGSAIVSLDDIRLVKADYFTLAYVKDADAPNIGSAKFNYEQASQAIKQIAEAVGCDWYVDPSRNLHFFAPTTEPAPFNLSDTSANFVWNSLALTQDSSTIKNQIIVRGGEYQGTVSDFDQVADGVSLNYRSPYRIKNISVQVNSVSQTVGVDNLDDPASFDCLYNFQEKNLKFKSATKPANGHTVRMTGNPVIPVIVKRGDPTSIAQHGIYEFLIVDKSIITQQGARDRAAAELQTYRDSLVEGGFTTDTAGLRAGQTISITITARSISDSYVIRSVVFRTKSPTEFIYDIELVSTRSFGIIEYLLALLRDQKKQITISDDEVVDLVQDITETVTITDAWAVGTTNAQTETITVSEVEQDDLNHGTVFVLTPYTPSGFADTKRPFILGGSLLA